MLRSLLLGIPTNANFRHMRSGGYLQFADIDFTARCDDGTMPDDTIFKTWEETADAFMKISQSRFFDAKLTKKELEDAGFVEIEEKRYKLPLCAWSSDPKYRELGRVSSTLAARPPPPPPFPGGRELELIASGVVVWEILGGKHRRMDFGSCDAVP
jgi:hypothetical protein